MKVLHLLWEKNNTNELATYFFNSILNMFTHCAVSNTVWSASRF